MTSKVPVTLKDGTKVRPIDVYVATLPPNPPADELARLALAGEIVDNGVVTVDCIGEKGGKPASITYNIFPPDIKWVNSQIPGATCVSYGTSTPASIYAELIVEGAVPRRRLSRHRALDRGTKGFVAPRVERPPVRGGMRRRRRPSRSPKSAPGFAGAS